MKIKKAAYVAKTPMQPNESSPKEVRIILAPLFGRHLLFLFSCEPIARKSSYAFAFDDLISLPRLSAIIKRLKFFTY